MVGPNYFLCILPPLSPQHLYFVSAKVGSHTPFPYLCSFELHIVAQVSQYLPIHIHVPLHSSITFYNQKMSNYPIIMGPTFISIFKTSIDFFLLPMWYDTSLFPPLFPLWYTTTMPLPLSLLCPHRWNRLTIPLPRVFFFMQPFLPPIFHLFVAYVVLVYQTRLYDWKEVKVINFILNFFLFMACWVTHWLFFLLGILIIISFVYLTFTTSRFSNKLNSLSNLEKDELHSMP